MISPFLKKQAILPRADVSRSPFFHPHLSVVKKAVSLYINVGAIALGTKISRYGFCKGSAIALLGKDDLFCWVIQLRDIIYIIGNSQNL
jgi:hypothetical protein